MILSDAETRFDPTGTSAIRAKFRGENDRRWARLRVLLVTAITKHDLLALDPNKIESIGRTTDRVQGFEVWLSSALKSIVTSDETWIKAGVLSAVGRAHKRASRWGEPSKSPHDRSAHLQSLAVAEFKGLCGETLRRCVRIVAHGLLAKVRAGAVASQVAREINVAKKRGRMAANHSVVLAHGKATLDAFRARGITHVGVTPEKKPRMKIGDDKDEHGYGSYARSAGSHAGKIAHRISRPHNVQAMALFAVGHIVEHYVPGSFMGGGYDEEAIGHQLNHLGQTLDISRTHAIDLMTKAVSGMIAAKKKVMGIKDAKDDASELEALEKLIAVLEKMRKKIPVEDAVGWSPGLEGAKASRIFARIKSPKQMPSKRQLEKIERAEEELQRYESVEVLTAGDEKVCDECQDISDEGPYDVDTAESLIPAHLECRCAFVPADDARFANVRE